VEKLAKAKAKAEADELAKAKAKADAEADELAKAKAKADAEKLSKGDDSAAKNGKEAAFEPYPMGETINVPGDGYCIIWSLVTSSPRLLSLALSTAGLPSTASRLLADTTQIRGLMAALEHQHEAGIASKNKDLVAINNAIRARVKEVARRGVDDGTAGQTRQALAQSSYVTELVAGVSRADAVTALGLPDQVTHYAPIGVPEVVRRYREARTALAPVAGPERQQELARIATDTTYQPDGTTLADNAVGPDAMIAYLNANNRGFRTAELNAATFLAFARAFEGERTGPFTASEIRYIEKSVDNWSSAYADNQGEFFVPLLAAAFGVFFQIGSANGGIRYVGNPTHSPVVLAYVSNIHYRAVPGHDIADPWGSSTS
jgi:hypothetical protein